MKIRSPIITLMGHINHGKTSILDKIRGSCVVKMEPEEITQHISSTFVPLENIRKICGFLMEKFNFNPQFPGLLFIDTPGHAAFVNLRKRGGSVADISLLVIDINEGVKEQTDESIKVLKMYKTPFVVALNKIDKIPGWKNTKKLSFLEAIKEQNESVKAELDKRLYNIVAQLSERGFDSERIDRITDFRKQVCLIPVSAKTGEGIAEILLILSGLAQKFLFEKLEIGKVGKGVVLEVKEMKGVGDVIDCILFDGCLKKNDRIVIGGRDPIITRVKFLLLPRPLKDIKVEKKFIQVKEVFAAAGVRIAADNLEKVIPGAPFRVIYENENLEEIIKEVQKEVEQIEFKKEIEGIVIKADTLGSLEALTKMLEEKEIPIKKAEVGRIVKEDFVLSKLNQKEEYRVILCFNIPVSEEEKEVAKEHKVKIFSHNVIYRLIEEYEKFVKEVKEKRIQKMLMSITRPVIIKVLPDFIFRRSEPAIFGVEVIKGFLKKGSVLKRKDGKIVGKVKDIQKENRSIEFAKTGERVAISIQEAVVGRTFKDNATLISHITPKDLEVLRKYVDRITQDEKMLLKEWGLL